MQITGDWAMLHTGRTNIEKFTNPNKLKANPEKLKAKSNIKETIRKAI